MRELMVAVVVLGFDVFIMPADDAGPDFKVAKRDDREITRAVRYN